LRHFIVLNEFILCTHAAGRLLILVRSVNVFFAFYKSSIGKKWVVALTGLVLVGYVFGHLAGNLQVFLPPEQINNYAEFLHSHGGLLWVVRAFLIACFVLHIFTTIKLVIENRAARPEKYKMKRTVQATIAARTMTLSGLIVLSFVIFHLLHFTARTTDSRFKPKPEGLLNGEYDVHSMMILGFQNPWVSGFYLLSVFLVCLHLSHGLSSLLQTFGINSKGLADSIKFWGQVIAWLVFVGYASIPVAVLAGYLKLKS
jgi:succinate dehydrogenase / fumarate reductase cytochrome b subunit